MSQQINLFNPLFLKRRKHFSAVTMAQALVVLIVGLASFYGYARYKETLLANEAAATTRSFQQERERLAKISAELSPDSLQKQLEEEIKASEALIATRRGLLDKIQSGALGNTRGYSPFLTALARQVQPGLWLTSIQMSEGADRFSINGRAKQAELVSIFVGNLRREAVLKGRPFEALSIVHGGSYSDAGTERPLLDFQLSSQRPAAPEPSDTAPAKSATQTEPAPSAAGAG